MSEPYPDTRLFIDGQRCEGAAGCAPVVDPATAEPIGRVHRVKEPVGPVDRQSHHRSLRMNGRCARVVAFAG